MSSLVNKEVTQERELRNQYLKREWKLHNWRLTSAW